MVAQVNQCPSTRPAVAGGEVCAYNGGHAGRHGDGMGRLEWGVETIRDCPDCAAKPGQAHDAGCDVERCSYCGGQWLQCGHSRTRKHDPRFARWTGLWPGAAEAEVMGLDLNEFHMRGLHEVFFKKP